MSARDEILERVMKALKGADIAGIDNYDVVATLVVRALDIQLDGTSESKNPGTLTHTCATEDGNAFRISGREGFLSVTAWNHDCDCHDDESECEHYEDDGAELEACMDNHCHGIAHIEDSDHLDHLYELIKFAAGK